MAPRKSTLFFVVTVIQLLLLSALFGHARFRTTADLPELRSMTVMVRQLGLTDLCLFTEASYTRHPAMTDFSTPFQDSYGTPEHFPSGALISPPDHIVRKDHYGIHD